MHTAGNELAICEAGIAATDNDKEFQKTVVVHAAVYGGMMANFGRIFAKRLVEEGAELHFFASCKPIFGAPAPIEDLESIGGQFHGFPLPQHFAPIHDIWTLLLMVRELRNLRPQIVHTRGAVMGAIGRVAAKLARVPIIINHQDDLQWRESGLSGKSKRLIGLIESLLAQMTDQSLFVSEAVLEDALSIGFPSSRCTFVGHDLNEVFQKAATDGNQTKEPVIEIFRNIGVPQGAKVVGCVGRLVHFKGIDLLLGAATRLASDFPDWAFVIKGDGPLREDFQSTIRRRGLSDRIFILTDDLPAHFLPALYQSFDVFALPTRREGFGMVFAEAMAMRVPVVAPRIAPVTEVVPEEIGILVEPDSIDALTLALGTLMSSGQLRERLAEAGQEYAVNRWCSEQAANRVLDIYRTLLVSKKAIA